MRFSLVFTIFPYYKAYSIEWVVKVNQFWFLTSPPTISLSFLGVKKNIFLSDVFSDEGLLIPWEVASVKFSIINYFKWMQIANSIPGKWKEIVRDT